MWSRPGFALMVGGAILVACSASDAPHAPSSPRDRVGETRAASTWSALPGPRYTYGKHTQTLLGDGRVLVAGGTAARDATELFDPRTGTWTDGPKMKAERLGHTATVLFDGRVLLAGGGTVSAELFDPRTGTTTATGSLNVVRASHAATRLFDGRVVVYGGDFSSANDYEIYDPKTGLFTAGVSGTTWHWMTPKLVTVSTGKAYLTTQGPSMLFDPAAGTWTTVPGGDDYGVNEPMLTLLADGRALTLGYCTTVGGSGAGPLRSRIFDPVTENAGTVGDNQPLIGGMDAALLPSGSVLCTGGVQPTTTPGIYDPATDTTASDEPTPAHKGSKATSLRGGDVLVVGGETAAADLRTWAGAVRSGEASIQLASTRAGHVAIPLHDGKVLLAGGAQKPTGAPPVALATAETVDPVARTSTATANSLAVARDGAAGVLLASGKVLVAGGVGLASADVYDPPTRTFHAAAPMTKARQRAAMARLAGGEILVVGGASDTSTELFDPTTETFRAGPSTKTAHGPGIGLVRLRDGRLLLVDPAGAELFDPTSRTFASTASPAVTTYAPSVQTTPRELVLVGTTGAATQLYDPGTQTWSTATALPLTESVTRPAWGLSPEGLPLMVGAQQAVGSMARLFVFDPTPPGGQVATVTLPNDSSIYGRHDTTVTIVPNARSLVAGGDPAGWVVPGAFTDKALLYGDGALDAQRPKITAAPSSAVGGDSLTLTGVGLDIGDTPLAAWIPDTADAIVPATVTSFTHTTATILAPSTAFAGPGWLHVTVRGVRSFAVPLALAPGKQAAACVHDAECGSGHCGDGVCCDRACGGGNACEACTAGKKGSGADGVCGVVPFGRGACKAPNGTACTDKGQCTTGFCANGVCCDSACEGTCLACDQEGSVGTCRAKPYCDLACDGAHTLKKAGSPDVDCAPYTCDGIACRTRCASVNECVAPAVCGLDGTCVAPAFDAGREQTMFGCSASSASRARGASVLGGLALAVVALAMRQGRRRR